MSVVVHTLRREPLPNLLSIRLVGTDLSGDVLPHEAEIWDMYVCFSAMCLYETLGVCLLGLLISSSL